MRYIARTAQRITIMVAGLMMAGALAAQEVITSHGYSFYGDLKYDADFKHLSYVNPDAPKGGELALSTTGTFDSFNPYATKGRAGAEISMLYESLMAGTSDTYGEYYGFLAHKLDYDVGRNWVIFHLRPEAQFSDGTPLRAEDVVFTHDLFLEQGLPSYAQAVKQRVLSAEALDELRVKFTFAPEISRRSLIEQVGGTPVFSKAWFEKTGARLDEPRFETSPGSGPYVLDNYDVNRRIIYRRNPEYWGNDLPINQGKHNFDVIRIEYFGDAAAEFEGFKAGEYTFRQEYSSRQWATGYDFPAVESGYVIQQTLPDGTPPNATGFVFNLQRDNYSDPKVREALSLAYNFEWTNASLQYGLFAQRHSYSQGSPFEPKGPPQGAELALLQSLDVEVPEAMLTEGPVMAHSSNPERLNDRRNLRKAMKLMDEAGWIVGDDGLRRNAQGETFEISFPISSSSTATIESILNAYRENLSTLGVALNVDKIDPSQFTARRRGKDYDMISSGYSTFLGAGTGLAQQFGSETAEVSVFNPASIANPVIDAVIEASLRAQTREEEYTALSALDRALRFERAMVPTWFLDKTLLAYWDYYGRPDVTPKYGVPVKETWWVEQGKLEKLQNAGALR